jgi:hypothetical protein
MRDRRRAILAAKNRLSEAVRPFSAVTVGSEGVCDLRPSHKRLIIGIVSIAVLDFAGLITMIANPDLTSRVIPALAGVQIFGFVAIAAIIVVGRQEIISADKDSRGTTTQLVPWLFGFLALLSFLRVILALLYIAGEQGRSHSWFSPVAGAAMGCAFLWLAFKTRPLALKRTAKQPSVDSAG